MAKPSGQNEREPSGTESPEVEDENDGFYILSDSNSLSVLNVPTVYPKAPTLTRLQIDSNSRSTQPFPKVNPETPTLTPLQIPSQGPSPSGGSPSPREKCGQLLPLCSQDSYCTDHPSGPCCHCCSGYYGNGRQCLPQGESGKLGDRVIRGVHARVC